MEPLPCGDCTVAYSVLNALVVLGNLLRPGVVRLQAFEEPGDRHSADGELAGAVEERAAIDVAVHVEVEEIEQLLRKVRGLPSFHGFAPWGPA